MGFCASGAEGIDIGFCVAIITSSGKRNSISKQTNNELFYLHSADGFGQKEHLIPTCTKPWT
jgi:hypothetical protein